MGDLEIVYDQQRLIILGHMLPDNGGCVVKIATAYMLKLLRKKTATPRSLESNVQYHSQSRATNILDVSKARVKNTGVRLKMRQKDLEK